MCENIALLLGGHGDRILSNESSAEDVGGRKATHLVRVPVKTAGNRVSVAHHVQALLSHLVTGVAYSCHLLRERIKRVACTRAHEAR